MLGLRRVIIGNKSTDINEEYCFCHISKIFSVAQRRSLIQIVYSFCLSDLLSAQRRGDAVLISLYSMIFLYRATTQRRNDAV